MTELRGVSQCAACAAKDAEIEQLEATLDQWLEDDADAIVILELEKEVERLKKELALRTPKGLQRE